MLGIPVGDDNASNTASCSCQHSNCDQHSFLGLTRICGDVIATKGTTGAAEGLSTQLDDNMQGEVVQEDNQCAVALQSAESRTDIRTLHHRVSPAHEPLDRSHTRPTSLKPTATFHPSTPSAHSTALHSTALHSTPLHPTPHPLLHPSQPFIPSLTLPTPSSLNMLALRSLLVSAVLALLAVSTVANPPPFGCNLHSSECGVSEGTTDHGQSYSIQIWYNPTTTAGVGQVCALNSFSLGPGGGSPAYTAGLQADTTGTISFTPGAVVTNIATAFSLSQPTGASLSFGQTATGSSLTGPSKAQIVITQGSVTTTYSVTGVINSDGCTTAAALGDPVLSGFHGQHFIVKGESGRVFNLISSPNLSFNNRFIALDSQNSSMSAAEMRQVRAQFKQSKMLELLAKASSDSGRPPVTTAWNHPGTYMGESGLTLGESKLYIAPGSYATGFSSVTLDGVAVPISAVPIELDGDMTVTRSSAFKVLIATPDVRFTIVNSDKFINIEHAVAVSHDVTMTGLLGETVDRQWEVVQSEEFLQHIENDFKLASDDLFGNDFPGKQF